MPYGLQQLGISNFGSVGLTPTQQTSIANYNVANGAVNTTAEETLHKHANPALKTRTNKYWNAIIKALASGDDTNWTNAQNAFDQLFKCSASGVYLDRKCAEDGIQRPAGTGMVDTAFRSLAITQSNDRVTQEAIWKILGVYYGTDAIRAYGETSGVEPYNLNDQDNLQVLIDEKFSISITFLQTQFSNISQASAIEVASVITLAFRAVGNSSYATAFLDPLINQYRLRIYSSSIGLGSSVRITGGKAQNGLFFPSTVSVYQTTGTLPVWTIAYTAATNTLRFTNSSASNVDLSQLQIGDYVNIYGSEFASNYQGTFSVTNVQTSYSGSTLTQYFEIINSLGSNSTVTQIDLTSIEYFRPQKQTTQKSPTKASVVSQGLGVSQVLLPTTTSIVGRSGGTGAYLPTQDPITITTATRSILGVVTVTAPTHGFPQPTASLPTIQIYIDGLTPTIATPTVTAGNPAGSPATTDYSTISVCSDLKTTTQTGCYRHNAVLLSTGDVLLINGLSTYQNLASARGVCELFSITGTNVIKGQTQYKYSWLPAASSSPVYTTSVSWQASCALTDGNGKVLMCGGVEQDGTTYSKYGLLYTPAIGGPGSWGGEAGTDMATARAGHALVPIHDVTGYAALAIGGCSSNSASLSSTERFNTATTLWTAGQSLNQARTNPVATLLSTGSILITGGRVLSPSTLLEYTNAATNLGTPLSSCEFYSISTGTCTYTGAMTYARTSHGACLLPDGRVLVVGGYGYHASQGPTTTLITQAEIWDPNTGIWSSAGQLAYGREFPQVICIPSLNRVYVSGGATTVIEYLDLVTMEWKISPASFNSLCSLSQGTLMSYGGNPVILLSGGVRSSTPTRTGMLIVPAAEQFMAGQLDGLVTATVVDVNTFTYTSQYHQLTTATGGTATWAGAESSAIPGPFVFDVDGIAITDSDSTITQAISKGHQYTSITVADATQFPDAPGYLCIGFGTKYSTSPIPYLGRLSSTALLIDYTFVFPLTIPTGTSVTWLVQKGGWQPPDPRGVGSFYITDSSSGRKAASIAIDDVAPAGISLIKVVEYPSDIGLGNAGYPDHGNYKLSDRVSVWGGNSLDEELATDRLA